MIIIGDNIIDEYWIGSSTRISPEAPVPVVNDIVKYSFPGGAGNVLANMMAFGENPVFICNPEQKTTKIRIVSNNHILCRLDYESYVPFSIPKINNLNDHNYAILSDYNKGVISYPKEIIQRLVSNNIKVLVDPKKSFYNYVGAWLIKANKDEFEQEAGKGNIYDSCVELCKKYGFKYLVVTLGSDGCYVYDHDKRKGLHIESEKRTVLDVTGAGDVFMASLGYYIQKGFSVCKSAKYANKLAGISVSHLGTYVITKSDIASVESKTVFTNGCFDVIHRGHIELLKKSKQLGKKLVVGLNSDESVRRLKGDKRPINNQENRKIVLESMDCVDEVIIFDEDTPYQLIQRLSPDIITKGGDYKPSEVVGNDLAEVVIIPYEHGYSSTGVIDEIKRKG